jgi:type 1 glutamine amidotransferase
MSFRPLSLIALLITLSASAAEPATKPSRVINAVVVTGGHAYDVKAFPHLFEGFDDVRVTHYPMKGYTEIFDEEHLKDWKYDVVVFYSMTQVFPEDRRQRFLQLLDKGVGVVSLHHNVWAYNDWPEFSKIIGGRQFSKAAEFDGKNWPQSTYRHGVAIPVHVEDASHPITAGISDWTIEDETYHGLWLDPDVKLLLTTTETTSDRPLAWCKTYGHARTVCIQLGHGPGIFSDLNYKQFVHQSILWTAPEKK